jgi:hypothetical protein
MRRHAAVESVIGHLKNDSHGPQLSQGLWGDRANAVLGVAGYNFQPALALA